MQHLKADPEPLEELRPDLARGLCRIVHKLLAKNPDDRFQSAAELLKELRTLQPASEDDEAWAAEAMAWIDHELASSSGPVGSAATQQLQTLMQKEALQAQERRRWIFLGGAAALLTLLAFVAGSVAAWSTRPKSLLVVESANKHEIKKEENVRAQWFVAAIKRPPSIKLYEAIEEYWPPGESAENLRHSRNAKERIAGLYRQQGNLDKAKALYKELTNVEATEPEYRVTGHFGLANIANQQSKADEVSFELLLASRYLDSSITDVRWAQLVLLLDPPLRDRWREATADPDSNR